MEIVAKISKGSKMDQIYIPKSRLGFSSGQYVLIQPLHAESVRRKAFRPYFYGVHNLEPIKLKIVQEIFNILLEENPENIIITGSFLEPGFKFNDIDILVIKEEKIATEGIRERIMHSFGIKAHPIFLSRETLLSGIATDPLYSMMLSRCLSKERIIFNVKRIINYKTLDIQLLKSKTLIDNYEFLSGEEKYYLALNLISILFFIEGKKLSKDIVNKEIEQVFSVKIKELKDNLINKKKFLKIFRETYDKTFNQLMEGIK